LDFGFFQEDGEQYSYDWRGFNLSSYKAYVLIKEHRKEIYDNARAYGVETEQLYPIGAETGN
jgi:hypothetical protein